MVSNLLINNELSQRFFKPLIELYDQSQHQYNCKGVSDLAFAQLGISRVASAVSSGHDFVQKIADLSVTEMSVDHFFKALKSPRRLKNLSSLNDLLAQRLKQEIKDPFASFRELKNWEIYAVDGHYQEHACHDPMFVKNGKISYAPTGHFFRLNLRTHHLSLLDTMRPEYNQALQYGKKKEHDTTIIKRATKDEIRYQAPVGKKVLLVWDKACIDYETWGKLKKESGTYFITMEKANSAAEVTSKDQCDHADPRNKGIESDVSVRAGGQKLRRITYTNPMDKKSYVYLTNELNLPAYLLVSFYKHRWDIEKVYYQLKSKFNERKSWATSTEAKQAQATFECLLHNLLLLMEEYLQEVEGLYDEQSEKQNRGRKLMKPIGFINQIVQRASHRSLKLIRWLRNLLFTQASWSHALKRLHDIWCLN